MKTSELKRSAAASSSAIIFRKGQDTTAATLCGEILLGIAAQNNPGWVVTEHRVLKETLNKVQGFKTLRENWDGYGAAALDDSAVRNALLFVVETFYDHHIVPFFVAPTRDGGVSVEYKFDHIKIVYRILKSASTLTVIKNNSQVISTTKLNDDSTPYLNPQVVFRTVTM